MKTSNLLDRRVFVYDMEVYSNWFCLVIGNGERTMVYTPENIGDLSVGPAMILAGFNNFQYDDVLLAQLLRDPSTTPATLRAMSDQIIAGDAGNRDRLFKLVYADRPWYASIDVFQLLNGRGSLKELACRSHAEDVSEAPYDFMLPLPDTDEGRAAVVHYCTLDVTNTTSLLFKHWDKVELRRKLDADYDVGLGIYRLPEQGIAQAVFVNDMKSKSPERLTSSMMRKNAAAQPGNNKARFTFSEILNPKVTFQTSAFQEMYDLVRGHWTIDRLDPTGTSWAIATESGKRDKCSQIDLAGCRFQLGVGGLHSIDAPGTFRSNKDYAIIDLDVTSYYPAIIIEDRLNPSHWDGFDRFMRRLRDLRVAAKKAGDIMTSEALKIIINSTFGKLNDFYSPFRSVPDALRVTINGQFYLLMLIEMLHNLGAEILSANTDGVTIGIARLYTGEDELWRIVDRWQKATGFTLETKEYAIYARRDVNNYLALPTKGKLKTKGAFCSDTGKGDGLVIKNAAVAFITKGTPIAETVAKAPVTDFIFYQRCRNGGTLYYGDEDVGRLARWVVCHPAVGLPLRRKNPQGTWATLPNAACVHLCMRLVDLKDNYIDLPWYIAEAEALVASTRPTEEAPVMIKETK